MITLLDKYSSNAAVRNPKCEFDMHPQVSDTKR